MFSFGLSGDVRPLRPVRTFLDWWLGELIAMLPGALRRAVRLERERMHLELSDGRLRLELGTGAGTEPFTGMVFKEAEWTDPHGAFETELSRIEPGQYRIVLALDDANALRRDITLPRAALPELAELLEFEIERHTPFRAGEVYAFHEVDESAGDDTYIAVTLVVIPRRIVDPVIERLAAHGLAPEEVTLSDQRLSPGTAARALAAGAVSEMRPPVSRRVKVMVGLAALLIVAAAVSPVLRLSVAADRLAAEMARAAPGAEASLVLQRQADRLTDSVEAVARAKALAPSPLRVLDALSRLLPDDTWLVQVGIAGGEVTLEGRTNSSATLVGLLEASPEFGEVTYLSPVTREPGGDFERFNFSVKLAEN